MAPEELYKIFKDKFENASEVPDILNWKKEDAWNKLQKKSKRQNLRKLLKFSSAAIFIVFVFISFPKIEDVKNRNSINAFNDEHKEYRKRQKLREIEIKLSGKKVYKNYCMNCEGILPNKNKLNRNILIFTN